MRFGGDSQCIGRASWGEAVRFGETPGALGGLSGGDCEIRGDSWCIGRTSWRRLRFGETFQNRIHVSLSQEACGRPAGTEHGVNTFITMVFSHQRVYESVEDNKTG